MKTRLIGAATVALISAAAAFTGSAGATDPAAFSGQTLAKATFASIDSRAHIKPGWREKIVTQGASDLTVQLNTWDPKACTDTTQPCIPSTGWHTHPGPSFVIVTQGTITEYDGDDPGCTAHVYTANTPNNSFVDPGDGHVHIVRDESGALAQAIVVRLTPGGSNPRIDAPAPGNCPF